jgi:hypothetical protein
MEKVQTFQSAAVEGWREGRVLPDLASLTGLEVRRIPLADWTGNRFGYGPRLDPKGLFVTPTNWVGLEDNARERGRLLAQGEVTDIIRLVVEHAPEVDVEGDPMQRLLTLLAQLRADHFDPSLIVLPIEWRLSSALGLEVWREGQTRTGLGRNFKGVLDGVSVIDWWEVPKDRMYAIDVARFCEVEEGVEADGAASPPEVSVERIDDALANEIMAHWDPVEGDEEQESRMGVITSVRTSILRPYRVHLIDPASARSVLVPPHSEE